MKVKLNSVFNRYNEKGKEFEVLGIKFSKQFIGNGFGFLVTITNKIGITKESWLTSSWFDFDETVILLKDLPSERELPK